MRLEANYPFANNKQYNQLFIYYLKIKTLES